MMVHSWDTIMVIVKVVDNDTGKEHFMDPWAFVQTNRWNKHAAMCVQYAECLKKNLQNEDLSKFEITGKSCITFYEISLRLFYYYTQ